MLQGRLGYRRHDVGVFLDVFEDHIDSRSEIKDQHDLSRAKSFIFSKVSRNGWAVFNADDEFVCSVLDAVPDGLTIRLLPCGRTFEHFDINGHLANGGMAMILNDTKISLKSQAEERVLYEFKSDDMTYGGCFEPSMWNMLHACGAIYGLYDGCMPIELASLLKSYRPSTTDGRLVKMTSTKGVTIIADYAHEKNSLRAVAKLGRSLVKRGGRLTGVVRLNHERPDDVLYHFGELAGDLFDDIVVYDKIDGYWRRAQETDMKRFPREVGRTSLLVAEGASRTNKFVERIVREDQAVAYAARHAKAGDVVVVIINDDVKRSLGFIKENFSIEPVDHERAVQDTERGGR